MRSFLCALILFAATSALPADDTQEVVVRGWIFVFPASLTKKVHDGPDFTVTYLSSEEKKLSVGIYEGMHPQRFSEEKSEVRTEKAEIGGQKVEWFLWNDETGGQTNFGAEIFFVIKPGALPEERFHVFIHAATQEDLQALQAVVMKAHP